MGSRLLALVAVLALVVPAAGQTGSLPSDQVSLRSEGNELVAWRRAPVLYRTLEALTTAVERPLGPRSRAIRVVRAVPPEIIDYILCVTGDGTLILGEQVFAVDTRYERNVFLRGGIARAYMPLDRPGPWVWLVEVPVGREMNATLVVWATTARGPVRDVVIDVGRVP